MESTRQWCYIDVFSRCSVLSVMSILEGLDSLSMPIVRCNANALRLDQVDCVTPVFAVDCLKIFCLINNTDFRNVPSAVDGVEWMHIFIAIILLIISQCGDLHSFSKLLGRWRYGTYALRARPQMGVFSAYATHNSPET